MSSEEDLKCPICPKVFKEPVILTCSHSFCKDCLRSFWREKPTRECPVCQRRSSKSDPPLNLVLRNLCEAYVSQREQTSEEPLCEVHSERLKLFCLTDQQPLCVICQYSEVHEDHRFRPMAEAARDLRGELDKSLVPLKKNLQKAKKRENTFKKKADIIKKQFHRTERQIQAEFKKLHQFLLEEEESRMKVLREEEEQKTQRMKDKMEAVSREIEALSETIQATEEQLRASDVSFLLKYKAAVETVQCCPLLEKEPQLGPGAEIDQAKHLGNRTFNIWTNMKRLVLYSPVILDPNRAINAILLDDLCSFIVNHEETGEDSEKRAVVFGSEGFDSGFHSWDVEVGDNEKWGLGVGIDPFGEGFRKEDVEWCGIIFSEGEYKAQHNNYFISVKLKSKPQRIKVSLDCDKHEVSFYDVDSDAHIHTFTQISQNKLFPYFDTKSKRPIKILPQKNPTPPDPGLKLKGRGKNSRKWRK